MALLRQWPTSGEQENARKTLNEATLCVALRVLRSLRSLFAWPSSQSRSVELAGWLAGKLACRQPIAVIAQVGARAQVSQRRLSLLSAASRLVSIYELAGALVIFRRLHSESAAGRLVAGPRPLQSAVGAASARETKRRLQQATHRRRDIARTVRPSSFACLINVARWQCLRKLTHKSDQCSTLNQFAHTQTDGQTQA